MKAVMSAFFGALALPIVFMTNAVAHSYQLGEIAVGHIWVAPTQNLTGAAVHVPVVNRSSSDVQLIAASSPIAERTLLQSVKDGKIQWLDRIDLASKRPVALAPWREHVWLSGLKQPLKEGDSFELLLDFGPAGQLVTKVVVEGSAGH